MKIPKIPCIIEAKCEVNPSEDVSKVQQAVSNVILDAEFNSQAGTIKAASKNLESLSKIYQVIRNKKTQRAFRRQIRRNLDEDSSWFYLNKQAAFVNVIALCEESDESPLGPIKVKIKSKKYRSNSRMVGWPRRIYTGKRILTGKF